MDKGLGPLLPTQQPNPNQITNKDGTMPPTQSARACYAFYKGLTLLFKIYFQFLRTRTLFFLNIIYNII